MSRLSFKSKQMIRQLFRLVTNEHGATAIEYAIIAAGVGMAVSTVVWGVGSTLKAIFYDAIAALL
jgi:Flp pilus assembly pilin Flp